jgi:hypothetical protein
MTEKDHAMHNDWSISEPNLSRAESSPYVRPQWPRRPRPPSPADDIGFECVLLCRFGADLQRELSFRELQSALVAFGLHPAAARHLIRTTPLIVPASARRYRLAAPPAHPPEGPLEATRAI